MSWRAAVVAFGLSLASACAPPLVVSLAAPAKPLTLDDYDRQLKRWTRVGNIRRDFDSDLMITATLHAPEFQSAYIARTLDFYKVGAEAEPIERDKLLGEIAGVWQFHVESAAHRFELNDLSIKHAIWRIVLLDDHAREVEASEVRPDKPRRVSEPILFPYADDFTRGWRIRFPATRPDGTPTIADDSKTLTLRFSGPTGSTDLVWQLK